MSLNGVIFIAGIGHSNTHLAEACQPGIPVAIGGDLATEPAHDPASYPDSPGVARLPLHANCDTGPAAIIQTG